MGKHSGLLALTERPSAWLPLKGFRGIPSGLYEVTLDGVVRSVSSGPWLRKNRGRTMTKRMHKGYEIVSLSYGGRTISPGVHQLVAHVSLGPADGMWVNHIDFDRTNNCAENLEYVTPQGNVAHTKKHMRQSFESKHHKSTINEETALGIFEMVRSGRAQKDVAALFGVPFWLVSTIMRGRAWCHVTGMTDQRVGS